MGVDLIRDVPREDGAHGLPVLDLGPEAMSRGRWLREMWGHRGVIWVLSRKDFQARYKRASLGVLWAVAVPVIQGAVMVFVFSHFVRTSHGIPYGAYVLSGVLPWGYFAASLPTAATAIVDGTDLTDKVWFPRAILPLVPCLSGLVGLGISTALLLVVPPILGTHPTVRLLLLVPACLLLVAFTVTLTSVLAALQVYFRDVRFIAVAALSVWLYATPIMYPRSLVGSLGPWLSVNPMTGVIALFHLAVVGRDPGWPLAVAIAGGTTLVLAVIAVEAHRRHDRLFVDLL